MGNRDSATKSHLQISESISCLCLSLSELIILIQTDKEKVTNLKKTAWVSRDKLQSQLNTFITLQLVDTRIKISLYCFNHITRQLYVPILFQLKLILRIT